MNIREAMNGWGRDFLSIVADLPDGTEVQFEDYVMQGCDTCGPDYTLEVSARDAHGGLVMREFDGRLPELIQAITEWEAAHDANS